MHFTPRSGRRRAGVLATVLAVGALGLAACGDDEESPAGGGGSGGDEAAASR